MQSQLVDETPSDKSQPEEQAKDKGKLEQEQFLARVKQAEELAQKSPRAYMLRVVAWALIGYLYMFIVPVCLILFLLLIIFFASKFSIVSVIFGLKPVIAALFIAFGCYVKALWVRFEPPKGHELKRKEFPQLFAFIDNLSKQTGVKVDHVILRTDSNAGVVQYPKFGLFGFYKNYLEIGLTLMLALSEKEFQSVIAHELGHLAQHHSKRSAWVYSMRARWSQIMNALDAKSSFLLVIMIRFLDWYQPHFLTLTQVIARRQEREADDLAINIAGADAHARSFLALTVREGQLNNQAINAFCRSHQFETKPIADFYHKVAETITAPVVERELLIDTIERLLIEEAHPFDTHPAHAERIRSSSIVTALDGLPLREKAIKLIDTFALDAAIEKNSAATIFGADYKKVLDLTSQQWQTEAAESWAVRAEQLQKAREKQEELDKKKADGSELTLDEQLEYANIVEGIEGTEAALPYFQAILQEHKDEPESAYTIGAYLLLTKIDEAGIPLLEMTAKANLAYCQQACHILIAYYTKHKDEKKIEEYTSLVISQYEERYQFQLERSGISHNDELVAHTATPAEVEALLESLKQFNGLRAVYLLEKVVKVEKTSRLFLLLIRLEKDPGTFEEDQRFIKAQELCHQVASIANCPESFYVQVVSGKNDPFLQSAAKQSNALIWGTA